MEIKYFSLSTRETNRFVNIIRIVFGIICLAVSVFWIIFNIRSVKTEGTVWITIIFLASFGFYQIWAGLGRATSFIEIGETYIQLKRSPILPPVKLISEEIERIELFPLNMIFFLKSGKKTILRFGTTYPDIIDDIKDAVIAFAESQNIILDIIDEKI